MEGYGYYDAPSEDAQFSRHSSVDRGLHPSDLPAAIEAAFGLRKDQRDTPDGPSPGGNGGDRDTASNDPPLQLRDIFPDSEANSGYFGSQTTQYHPHGVYQASKSGASSPVYSREGSSVSLHNPKLADTRAAESLVTARAERPMVITTDSSRTITASPTAGTSTTGSSDNSRRQSRQDDGYPVYPNQAFSVLHSQRYPTRYPPQPPRARSYHPSVQTSYPGAPAPSRSPRLFPTLDTGSRTVGNTPVSTPGLFNPPRVPSSTASSDDGYYSSPTLHWTQYTTPIETHVADVDVDPVSGRKLINQYEIIEELGRGQHGKVKKGRNLNNSDFVAIKIVTRYSKRRRLGKLGDPEDKVKKEVAILKKARHPNVVSLLEVIDDPNRKKVYLVLEFVERGEILWRRKGVKEIVLIERRRIEREAQGLPGIVTSNEEEMILKKALEQREKKNKYRRKHTAGEPYWSLEYGGESEEESSESEPMSRIDTHATDFSAAGRGRIDSDAFFDTPRQTSSVRDGVITPRVELSPEHEENDERRESETPPYNPSPSHWYGEGGSSYSSVPSAIEGLIYSEDAPEILRGRTPSVAESLISHMSSERSYDPFDEDYAYVPCLTLSQARQTFRDTVLGLEYLHYQGIIHRDIKPANLLWTSQYRVKISDFGVSYLGRPIRDDENGEDLSETDAQPLDEAVELAKTVGTPAFYAPELCYTDPRTPRTPVTGQIDVWALGVTLYCLIYARLPFNGPNEFAMFRSIAEDDVFVSRKRLKAVDTRLSPNQATLGRNNSGNMRAETQLAYEDVDDSLNDLLRRLLHKDPAKRITLKEVKHHPWVLEGIADPVAWIEETDPSRQSHGRKIEVSTEEVATAVVPVQGVKRFTSNVFKHVRSLFGSRKGREESDTSEKISRSSTPSTLAVAAESGRRKSLRGDESIYSALKASRESSRDPREDHPLSRSVAVSPDTPKEENPFLTEVSNLILDTESEKVMASSGVAGHTLSPPRPDPPERALSSAESTRTIRARRESERSATVSPPPPQGLPGTPITLDPRSDTSILGGTGRRLVRSMRSRELDTTAAGQRAHSVDRSVSEEFRAEPSIALSTTIASGHVDLPEALKEVDTPPGEEAEMERGLSKDTASGPPVVIEEVPPTGKTSETTGDPDPPSSPSHITRPTLHPRESTAESFTRAQDENFRRRKLEFERSLESPVSASEPRSNNSCPPSPDDEIFYEKQRKLVPEQRRLVFLPLTDTASITSPFPPPVSSSSDDQLAGGISPTTSHPSMPSMISANSSVSANSANDQSKPDPVPPVLRTEETLKAKFSPRAEYFPTIPFDDDAGYSGDRDRAVETDDESDSDDEFLIMTRRRSRVGGFVRSESVSNAQLSRRHVRRGTGGTGGTGKTSRSGSSGTVKKVRRSEGEDDRSGVSTPATPAA